MPLKQQNETTRRYLEGRLRFEDTSDQFLYCRCSRSELPHNPHWNEYPLFEEQRRMRYGTAAKTDPLAGERPVPQRTIPSNQGADPRKGPQPGNQVLAGTGAGTSFSGTNTGPQQGTGTRAGKRGIRPGSQIKPGKKRA